MFLKGTDHATHRDFSLFDLRLPRVVLQLVHLHAPSNDAFDIIVAVGIRATGHVGARGNGRGAKGPHQHAGGVGGVRAGGSEGGGVGWRRSGGGGWGRVINITEDVDRSFEFSRRNI